MKKENEKKKVILMIVGIIALMLVIVGATFAYFNAQVGKGDSAQINAQTGTTDSLTFNISDIDVTDNQNKVVDENNNEDDIIINANQSNFGPNGNNIGDGVKLNAHLIANNTNPLTASYTYNLYLDISQNNLEYSSYKYNDKVISFKTKEERDIFKVDGMETEDGDYIYFEDLEPIPELVLVVQKPDGNYVDNIGKLSKNEITIEGKSVSCFDITEVNDILNIAIDYPIGATEENEGVEDQNWQVRVIFKNLETDQHLNTNKTFQANLSIQSEKIDYLDLAGNFDEENYEYTDYRAGGHYDDELGDYVPGYNEQIKNVNIVNYIADEEELTSVAKWDLSSSKDGNLMAWLKGNEDPEVPYDLYIGSNLEEDEKIKVRSFAHAFEGLSSVETIDLNPSILDTTNLIDTSYMFSECSSLKNITDLKNLDVSNVTDMSYMFAATRSLTILDLSGWNTHNVTNMSAMFAEMISLTEITGIEEIDVSQVINMSSMFGGTAVDGGISGNKISKLNLSKWDTQNVTNMSYMFSGMGNLTTIEGIENFDVSQVTNMSSMFEDASGLTTLDLSGWKTQNVTDMSNMFTGANSLTTIEGIENFDVSRVTNMSSMFYKTSDLISLDLSNWDTQNVTDMPNMFAMAYSLNAVGNLNNWNVHNVTDMFAMFYGTELTTLDLSGWDTSEVTNMSYMFENATGLTTLDLSGWDTSEVTNMSGMFQNTSSLTSIDMRNATFSQVTSYDGMFANTNYALKVTITGDANKQWFLDSISNDTGYYSFGLKESQLEVLPE